jgi:5-methylcytosine-specific restriction endonuclease McrA
MKRKPTVECICDDCGKKFLGYSQSRWCPDCRPKYAPPDPKLKKSYCAVCGYKGKSELFLHHIKSFALDGTSKPENIITLCKSCHKAVHFIRKKQNLKISKKGWETFKMLVKNCKTRYPSGSWSR